MNTLYALKVYLGLVGAILAPLALTLPDPYSKYLLAFIAGLASATHVLEGSKDASGASVEAP